MASIEELNDPEEVLQILTLVIFQGLADPLWARENSYWKTLVSMNIDKVARKMRNNLFIFTYAHAGDRC
jgi:hypothetical protein